MDTLRSAPQPQVTIPQGTPLVVDYESVEIQPDGSTRASTEAYRANFRVLSLAAAWRVDGQVATAYIQGEPECRAWLAANAQGRPLVAHNIQFEMLVSVCRFPELELDWQIDTMRLAQNHDNGGDEALDVEYVYTDELDEESEDGVQRPKVKRKPTTGLGLVACSKRILGLQGSHKDEAHAWLRANGVKKGKEGAHLDKLPPEVLERYNIADAEVTLALYEHLVATFDAAGFDWRIDHGLFLSTVHHLVCSKIAGIAVDRATLRRNLGLVQAEIAGLERDFLAAFATPISAIEVRRTAEWINTPKTERGREQRRRKIQEQIPKVVESLRFNPGSSKQLEELFAGELGIVPKFFTAKGAPSFKSSVLGQWGDGGLMLAKRRKRLLVAQQMESLLALSEHDGKWHVDLRACGTATGRFAGGK